MKLKIYILLLFSILTTILYSQDNDFFSSGESKKTENKEKKLERWSFGGNFWASFGSNSSYVEVSPIALYKFTPRFMAGPGFTYTYQKSNYFGYKTHSYGPRAMATYTLFANLDEFLNINIGNVVLHSEFEYLNQERLIAYINGGHESLGRTWEPYLLGGGGIFQPIGRGGISLLVLYSFIDSEYSPYDNPVIRMGFYF